MPRLVEVVFPLPLDQTFTYDVPDSVGPLQIGQRVLAPFQNRKMTGYVVGLPATAGDFELKPIEAILDDAPILTPELLALARKMAQVYGASFGEAIQTVLPPGLVRQTRRFVVALERDGEPEDSEEVELFSRIKKGTGLDFVSLVRRNPGAAAVIRRLEKKGFAVVRTLLRPERARVRKKAADPFDSAFDSAPEVTLNDQQSRAVDQICASIRSGKFDSFLLYGITGSGKTEVYLQAAASALNLGKNVLALVPEIALTPQFVGRFRARFGAQIALLHSARSESERLTEWIRIRKGEARIVIGARSALFAPIRNIGLVVVDEEHDPSYKQHEGLLYHAKDLARFRAQTEKATLVLGSATPSLETYQAAVEEKIQRLDLSARATGQNLPDVEIVDLRETHVQSGKKGMFSPRLLEALADTLGRGDQAVLFLNRRGFAPSVLCPTCGTCIKCDQCSVALTYHQRERIYLCHYCGKSKPNHFPCETCGQKQLIPLGMGTERIEQDLNFHFPDARIERMDRDSVRRKGEHERILTHLATGKADILVGTQMVTKGLDLPNVTLVGVLLADQGLHFPDFRAAERTFQLLTQVVGRSGRAQKKGTAIIQTFQPEHYAVRAAAAQDFGAFFDQEIRFRKELQYPPFKTLSLIELSGKERESVRQTATWLAAQGKKLADGSKIDFLGPAPAPVEKVDGKTRYHLIVRGPVTGEGAQFARWLCAQAKEGLSEKNVGVKLDLDG